jgi:hypothetical protein
MLLLQIAAGFAFVVATPMAMLAWASALPGTGSARGVLLLIPIAIPLLWLLLAGALLYWYGVSGEAILVALGLIGAWAALAVL